MGESVYDKRFFLINNGGAIYNYENYFCNSIHSIYFDWFISYLLNLWPKIEVEFQPL